MDFCACSTSATGTVNGSLIYGRFIGPDYNEHSYYNCYSLAETDGTDDNGVANKTAGQFKSGEVAYWLSYPYNGEDSRFRQNLGTDPIPKFSGKPVYYGDCVYHNHNSGDVFCIYCDKPEVYDWTYRIRSKENLYWFAALINGTNGLKQEQNAKAVLMTDITVDDNFISIGNNGAFTGTFDGQGHKISGVTGSLFGSSSGTITDLALQSGVLCTTNAGTISMCSTEGELLCNTNSNIIENSYIRYSGSNNAVLCGKNTGTIKNCYSASPSGSAAICSSGTEGVQNCYCLSGATVSSVGSSEELTTTKPFASGEVAYLLNEKGSFRIWYQNIDNGNTADNTPRLHGDKSAIVYKTSDDSTCQGYTNQSNGIKQHDFVDDVCSYCGKVKLTEPPKGRYTMSSGTSSGIEQKEAEAYEISTKGQFYWFCALVNGTDGLTQDTRANAVLKADINVDSNYPYTSSKRYMMNEYHGLFSGEGHTISSNMSYLVLSNYGTISNSRLTSGAICDVNQEGGFVITCSSNGTKLCYINSGLIRNCYLLNQKNAVLCTINHSIGQILYCYSASSSKTATICTTNDQGGIIRNCYCLSRSKASAVGVATTFNFNTEDPFASGEVAFLLNKGNGTHIWRQNIDNENTPDKTPVLNGDNSTIVYKTANDSPCQRYTNRGKSLTMQHHYVNGICSYCKLQIVENLTEVTILGITAKDKYYNGTTAAEFDCSNAVITGLASGDVVQVIARGTFSDKNVGTNKVVTITDFELTGKDAYKYTIVDTGNQATSKAAIKQKKVNVYPAVSPKEYDGTTSAEVNLTIDTSDICSGDSIEVSGVTGTYEDASVGNDKLVTIHKENMSVTGEGSGNYYINIYFSTFKGTITKKALTVQPENKSISYGDEKPGYTLAYTGLAECDNTDGFKDNLKKDLVISCPYVQPGQQGATPDNSEIGDYTITLSETSSDEKYKNYTLTCKDGTLTVGPKELGITWGTTVFTYNGSSQMPTAVATGMLNNDDISLTVETLSENLVSVNPVNAGTYTAKVTKITGSNVDKYKLPADVAQSYEIRPAALSDKAVVSLTDADSLTYTGTEHKPAVTVTLDGKTLEEWIDYTVTYSNNINSTTDTQKAAVTVNGRGNYSGTASKTFDIKKKALEITAEDKSIRYGEDTPSFTAKYDGFVNGETKDTPGVLEGTLAFDCAYQKAGSASTGGTETEGFGENQNSKAGTYPITPKGLTSANYDITFKPGTLTVNKAAGKVTIGAVGEKNYGDKAFNLPVDKHGSDGTLTYESSNADVITVDGDGNVTLHRVGKAKITVFMAEGTNHTAAQNTLAITVAKKAAKLDVTSLSYTAVYGDADIDLGLKTESENEVTYTTDNPEVATAKAGKLHITGAGTAVIHLSMPESANYLAKDVDVSVTVEPAELTVIAENKATVYGTDAPGFTAVYSGFVNGDSADKEGVLTGTLTFACGYENGDSTNGKAGTYDIVPKGLTGKNYKVTYKKGTLTVKKAAGQITIDTIGDKTYGDAGFALTVDKHGSDGTLTYTSDKPEILTADSTGNVKLLKAGTARITVSMAEGTNYTAASNSIEITVKKKTAKLEVSSLRYTAAYGDADIDLGLTAEGESTVAYESGDNSVVTVANGKIHIVGAGEATITLSMPESTNYLETKVDITVKVNPAPLTIKAEDKSTDYGKDAPAFTVRYDGFKNGDKADTEGVLTGILGVECSYQKGDATNGKAGTYTITPGGLVSANYAITYETGTLTVKKAVGQITIAPVGDKTYGDADFALTVDKHGSDGTLTYASSDEKVVKVSESGMVSVIGAGTATIKVSMAESSNYTAVTKEVTVNVFARWEPNPTPSVTPSPTPSATPSPTPSVTPRLTPSATPSPTPSPTPSAKPTVNPSEEIEPLQFSSVKQTQKTITLTWGKVKGADGYIIYGNRCNTSKKKYKMKKLVTITNGNTKTWTQKKLEKGTSYKYYIKAYQLVNGKKKILKTSLTIHIVTRGGKYEIAKNLSILRIGGKTGSSSITLKKGKTAQITAREIAGKKPIKYCTGIRYVSGNPKVASVSASGKIKAKKNGICHIWVYAQNGTYKKITVKVK